MDLDQGGEFNSPVNPEEEKNKKRMKGLSWAYPGIVPGIHGFDQPVIPSV